MRGMKLHTNTFTLESYYKIRLLYKKKHFLKKILQMRRKIIEYSFSIKYLFRGLFIYFCTYIIRGVKEKNKNLQDN